MNARRVIGALVLTVVGASACATVIGIDDLSIGACKGGVCDPDGSSSGNPDGSSSGNPDGSLPDTGCPSAAGPQMTRVGGTGNTFCIDTSEVTVGQYRQFVNTIGNDAGPVPAECKWKSNYAPGVLGADDLPQAGVDWCDAHAYCQWAGKRLCGKIVKGKFTGPIAPTEIGDPASSAWFIACSAEGTLPHPYGAPLQPGACNLAEKDAGKPLPVKTQPACQGGYPGVYDMLGNVTEWIDTTPIPLDSGLVDAAGYDGTPATEYLIVKGGDWSAPESVLECRTNVLGARRSLRNLVLGFRCCSE